MTSILDIAVISEEVAVNGGVVTIYPLSAQAIARLLTSFPELRAYFSGTPVETTDIFKSALNAVPAIIAAGVGSIGEKEIEAKAETLGLEAQVDIIAAILRLTMPHGVGPFVEKFTTFAQTLGAGAGVPHLQNSPNSGETSSPN